jgi:RimJ/RimL family protein N-acetyltransferase
MILKPIGVILEENEEFLSNPLCLEVITMTIDFHKRAGFIKPWIGYFAEVGGYIVGSGGFKGKPINGTIEISYGIFEEFRKQGFGTEVCRKLVELSLKTDPSLRITARTLPEKNFSTRILEKNNFVFAGTVDDPEDGEVWEWEFTGRK